MLIIALALTALVVGCALIVALAVHALPFFVGFAAAISTYRGTGSVLVALSAGALAGAIALALGHIVTARTRRPFVRSMVVAAFAVASSIAGYHVAVGLSNIASLSSVLQHVLGVIGAASFGTAACRRMMTLARSRRNRPASY